VGEGETDERLDKASEYLKELIVVVKGGFGEMKEELGGMREEVRTGFGEMKEEMGGMREEMRTGFETLSSKQDQTIEQYFRNYRVPNTIPSHATITHNRLANIHRNHLESTQIARRRITRQQNNRIPPKFHRVSQKNPTHRRKLPLTTSAGSTQPFGQPDQTQMLHQTQTPAQF
jgi:hypothetical protein